MKRAGISFIIIGCLTASLPCTAMAGKAAVNEVIGKTWNFVQGETKGQITYTKSAVTAKFGGKTYKGKLRLKSDKICTAYPELRDGEETCFGVAKSGSGYKTTHGATITP
jgi:uncharacterized membrane protein